MYVLSTCMTCACCLEACPQIAIDNKFIGAAAISQARLFNMNPTGRLNAEDRLRGLMAEGGIQDCGKAQNCVQVCPKEIPLTTSIAQMNRDVTKQVLNQFLKARHFSHLIQVVLIGFVVLLTRELFLIACFWVYALGLPARYMVVRSLRPVTPPSPLPEGTEHVE